MEVVLVDNSSYLFELVGFGFSIGAGLDVNNLWDLFMPGDHMGTSSLSELKMEMGEQFGCFFKSDVPCFVRVHDFFQVASNRTNPREGLFAVENLESLF